MCFFCINCGLKIIIYQEMGDQLYINDYKCSNCGFIMPLKEIFKSNSK